MEPETYTELELEATPSLLNQEEIAAALWREMPREVARRGGRVVLRLRVEPDGTVDPDRGVRVEESSDPALTDAVIRMVPRMRFSPGILFGRPLRVWVELPLEFAPRQ